MRVLIVTQFFEPEVGAPQVRLANFARQLLDAGHEVEVVTAMPNYPSGVIFDGYGTSPVTTEQWSSDPAVRIHRVWLKAGAGRGIARLIGFASFAAMLPLGLRRAHKPDLVVVNSPLLHVAPVALAASRMWRSACVLYAADLWPDSLFEITGTPNPLLARSLYWLERQLYQRADNVVAVTDGIYDTLVKEKGLDPADVSFLPNGVDIDMFSPDTETSRPAPLDAIEGPLFAFPGTLGYFNGLDVVVEAMSLLATERPEINFAFVGDGPERPRIEDECEQRQLDTVHFTGSITPAEVAALLPTLTAGVVCLVDLPVTRGARPAKTFPILSAGRPVIFVGVGEGPDLIGRAEAGLSVTPGDARGLADAMIRIVDRPDEAAAFGRSGRRYVSEHLSWRGLVRTWIEQIEATIPVVPVVGQRGEGASTS